MRRKIVLWGSNEKDEKILVALELLEKDNVVNIYTFPQSLATEEFYQLMSEKWRDDIDVDFPPGFTKIERKLSISDSLLPDEIKVERPDVITRAQAEWHFVVLSTKLYELYKSELEEFKEKVEGASMFEGGMWDDLKNFWTKVQDQVNERNLFREHGAALRERTNKLFEKLKELRKALQDELDSKSKEFVDSFTKEIQEIEDKIESGLGLNPLFDELKKIQGKLNDFEFTRKDRDKIWAKIDETFKKLKAKRAGGRPDGGNAGYGVSQIENRLNGLITAMGKMQKSIEFDQKDLDFENKRIAISDGQLESMLRQAKINMINERIASKQEKLNDMSKTKADLESRMDREKKRAVKVEKDEKLEEAKDLAKAKIAAEMEENTKAHESLADVLSQAANDLKSTKKAKGTKTSITDAVSLPVADVNEESAGGILDALSESVQNLVQDVTDTAQAVAHVVSEKLEDALDNVEDAFDKVEDVLENVADKIEDKIENFKEKKSPSTIKKNDVKSEEE